jgi:hypothetical protein
MPLIRLRLYGIVQISLRNDAIYGYIPVPKCFPMKNARCGILRYEIFLEMPGKDTAGMRNGTTKGNLVSSGSEGYS